MFLAMASQMIPRYGDTSWIYEIIKELIPPGKPPRKPNDDVPYEEGTISETYVAEDSITGEEVSWPKKKKGKNGSDNLSSRHPSRP